MSASSIHNDPDMGGSSDGENDQDYVFDPNFDDNLSLPQQPSEQAVWVDDGTMDLDLDLDLPPLESHFNDLFEDITAAHQAHQNNHGIDPELDSYIDYNYIDSYIDFSYIDDDFDSGYIDSDGDLIIEDMNHDSTATAIPDVASAYGIPDELLQLNDFAQPQDHGLPPSAFVLSEPAAANAAEVQRAVDQQTSMANLPPSIQIYNPDGQLTTSPTWLPRIPEHLPFDQTLAPSLFPDQQVSSSWHLGLASSSSTTTTNMPEPHSHSPGPGIPVQDPRLLQVPSPSSSPDESARSWLSRNFPYLAAATMSSSRSAQSSASLVSSESMNGTLAQDSDILVGLYDDEPPLNPSSGTTAPAPADPQPTADNGTNGSPGPNISEPEPKDSKPKDSEPNDSEPKAGQTSEQTQAAPEQQSRPVNANIQEPNLVQNSGSIRTPHYSNVFICYIGGGPDASPEAKCYVECLTPVRKTSASKPVLFLHGDHHTGHTWKYLPGHTETNLSWVDYFLHQGYTCYVPDMPLSGRSMGAHQDAYRGKEHKLNVIEGELTAPRDNLFPLYDTARYHCQFPGVQDNPSADQDVAGLRWDPYFLNYKASRVPVISTSEERIAYGAEAACMILDRIGKPTVIIAEGSGGVSGLIAADRSPDRVAGLTLMGYPYAPFAMPFQLTRFDNGIGRVYHEDAMEECTALTSGLTTADLCFDPPLALMQSLRAVKTYADEAANAGPFCFLQDAKYPIHRLANLARVPVLVVTPQAGCNSAYDWSVVAFLRQAGVAADWYKLARFGLLGNGELMWLERNGARVARLVLAWIVAKTDHANPAAAAAAAAVLALRPDQVRLADRREEEVRGVARREAARYEAAMEERRRAWAAREIAPLVQANADAMECFYSWLPVLDLARADFQAAQAAAAAATAAAAGVAGAGAGAAAAP
ncbi:hypothetical protein MGG_12383 [Pyricularia oryzae 70-15]|uniref:AB hydrolase-1 domain-containing protein n=1 Tax=Pyricularia oryzae (strain 70-15 / ATCC MYA-4617 / FGSC 8958) TaxID=242507 RepID=G4MU44_PYRO7|nr:uncharacterized protein MGG_12383 [Pyricularia oryzae 70-15]EHA55644.1 hypothetical protein MGG_12383 [Pyricularia oryzae 70-15]